MDSACQNLVSFIWSIADDVLRDVFQRGKYRDVILPLVILRRIDAILESTKDEVLAEVESNKGEIDPNLLCKITGQSFYNASKWTLNKLKTNAANDDSILLENFRAYLLGFSENVRDILSNFEYDNIAKKLALEHRLLPAIQKITNPDINLTNHDAYDTDGKLLPAIDNHAMGTLFEELLRKFNEENNEEAGEHFTPRDAINLLCRLVFEPLRDNLPPIIQVYDPACGSGGMLTAARSYLKNLGKTNAAIQLFGTEVNPETYAICKADLLIKGIDPEGIKKGNTIACDNFRHESFGFMLTNPPYGKSWVADKEQIFHGATLLDNRFELSLKDFDGKTRPRACTPRTSDGQLLFILEEVNKMTSLKDQPQGCRIASIHNGSSLFTGDAGSGESDIRRYLVENDFVDAIVQLPNNLFYNTGIATYVWILTNKKADNRKGKVQLIDASKAFAKLRKNLGNRNCEISEKNRDDILACYEAFENRETDVLSSKVFDNDDFRYYSVTVERPLRLKSRFMSVAVDDLRFDKSELARTKEIYELFGDEVYDGLSLAHRKELLEKYEDLTEKQVNALIDAKKWTERKTLLESAKKIREIVGDKVFTDYNVFLEKCEKAAKEADVKKTLVKTIARAMSVTDPACKEVIKKREKDGTLQYESDPDLRDVENIPVKDDIDAYFKREVLPYAPDAWMDLTKTKIGCEISFNKYFYKPAILRTLEENEADILKLGEESKAAIRELFK